MIKKLRVYPNASLKKPLWAGSSTLLETPLYRESKR